MSMMVFGPKDKWQHDIERMSRAALVNMVDELLFARTPDREVMEKLIARCKKYGRWDNQAASYQRFQADPLKAVAESIRRKNAAKKAAKLRKKAAKRMKSAQKEQA